MGNRLGDQKGGWLVDEGFRLEDVVKSQGKPQNRWDQGQGPPRNVPERELSSFTGIYHPYESSAPHARGQGAFQNLRHADQEVSVQWSNDQIVIGNTVFLLRLESYYDLQE